MYPLTWPLSINSINMNLSELKNVILPAALQRAELQQELLKWTELPTRSGSTFSVRSLFVIYLHDSIGLFQILLTHKVTKTEERQWPVDNSHQRDQDRRPQRGYQGPRGNWGQHWLAGQQTGPCGCHYRLNGSPFCSSSIIFLHSVWVHLCRTHLLLCY